jgi:cysteine-rich repeat protein
VRFTFVNGGINLNYLTFNAQSGPQCGNNIVETGENCDTGGDSATCDGDCTFVVCGDGRHNVPAGEGCDDANTTSGDGCSSSCVIEPPPGGCDDGDNLIPNCDFSAGLSGYPSDLFYETATGSQILEGGACASTLRTPARHAGTSSQGGRT